MTPSPRAAAADHDAALFWRRRARRTAGRHNFGRVLGDFLPAALVTSAVFACALLVVRQHGQAGHGPWIVYGVSLALCAGVAAWRVARRGFSTVADALVRLEWHLGLHNRLSAAAAGVGTFPPPQTAPDGYAFHWQKIAPPLAGALALVLAAAFIPVSRPAGDPFVPATPPESLAQTAQWLDTLQKTGLVQPPALEDFRERLEELRQQPARDWYSQSSLEAGDNLRGQTEQSLQTLQRDLRTAASSLTTMDRPPEQLTPDETKAATDQMQEALKGLELGNLPLNKDLLSQLKGLDPSKLKSLTPEQLEQLKEKLKNGVKITEAMLKPGKPGDKSGEAMALVAAGETRNHNSPGGPGGGKSSAPLDLHDHPTDLHTTTVEADANAANLDHALPGDIVGVGNGEHTVDPNAYAGPAAAGATASEGTGGETVWRDDLTPAERETLGKFFK